MKTVNDLTACDVARVTVANGWVVSKVEGYNNHENCANLYTHPAYLGVELHVHDTFNALPEFWIYPAFRFQRKNHPAYVVGLSYVDMYTTIHSMNTLLEYLRRFEQTFNGVDSYRKSAALARKVFGIR